MCSLTFHVYTLQTQSQNTNVRFVNDSQLEWKAETAALSAVAAWVHTSNKYTLAFVICGQFSHYPSSVNTRVRVLGN